MKRQATVLRRVSSDALRKHTWLVEGRASEILSPGRLRCNSYSWNLLLS